MKNTVSRPPVVGEHPTSSSSSSGRGPGGGRRAGRRTGGGRKAVNHRTPLEQLNASVIALVDDLVEEEEADAIVGPELLDPAFDAAEDLGSFVKLSTVTTALCGTWASWVADDRE